MSSLELILTALGEATATKLHKDRDSQGMPKLRRDAKDGGAVAGNARKDIESRTKTKVVTKDNFLANKRKNETDQDNFLEQGKRKRIKEKQTD